MRPLALLVAVLIGTLVWFGAPRASEGAIPGNRTTVVPGDLWLSRPARFYLPHLRHTGDSRPVVSLAPADDPLYVLRLCESGDNYSAISPTGMYFGAYQFSLSTWQAVGGTGYPHLAPPEEQDARAWVLLTQYGAQHWPVCQWRLQ